MLTADTAAPVRVMLCDDSAVARGALTRLLAADAATRVTAWASDGAEALSRIADDPVDVVVLDVEMNGMDGLTALPLLLRARPSLRVIMVSAVTTRGAHATLMALRLGAVDCIAKPGASASSQEEFERELPRKIKGLARPARLPDVFSRREEGCAAPPSLLAVGSSTGGPQALFSLIKGLGRNLPVPVVLTQHIPASFVPLLADQLTRLGSTPCHVARDDEALLPGHAYLAIGNRHLVITGSRRQPRARLSDGPPENFCRPSVDTMLRGAVQVYGGRVLVAMLTGMGQDGLAGTRAVVAAGGCALAQDEASSVVWGMPGAIAMEGLCHDVLHLTDLPCRLLGLIGAGPR